MIMIGRDYPHYQLVSVTPTSSMQSI